MPKNIAILLATALTFQWCAPSGAQDIIKTQRTLTEAENKLNRIDMLLPVCDKQSEDWVKLNASLAATAEEIGRAKVRLSRIEDYLQKKATEKFAKLAPYNQISWQVAPRQEPFLEALPEDLSITVEAVQTRIAKTGNPLDLPVSPSPSYHVCPSFELRADDRALLRFSIPSPPARGGTPVPYFGLRDADGEEAILLFINDSMHNGEEHEIRVYCTGHDGFAFLDGSLQFQRTYKVNELRPPLFMFFHMNDTSQLIIHELRLNRSPNSLDQP